MKIELHTPAEITDKHGHFLKDPKKFSFQILVKKILLRTAEVAEQHFGCEKIEFRKHPLVNEASLVEPIGRSPDAKYKRVIIRNKPPEHKEGGLRGTYIYEGCLNPFLHLLDAGVCLGFGKKTTSGFGQFSYQIVT